MTMVEIEFGRRGLFAWTGIYGTQAVYRATVTIQWRGNHVVVRTMRITPCHSTLFGWDNFYGLGG